MVLFKSSILNLSIFLENIESQNLLILKSSFIKCFLNKTILPFIS